MRSGSLHRSIVFVLLPFAFVSLTSSHGRRRMPAPSWVSSVTPPERL